MAEEKDDAQINKRAKIIVSSNDELTDILRKVSSLKDENILLTFAEESDLLISSINLKVILEVCDELKKNLILQIIQNSSGVRNARMAGGIVTESPSDVDEDLWLIAEKHRLERADELESALKGRKKDAQETIQDLSKGEEPVLQDSEYQRRVQEVIEKSKNLLNKDNNKIVHEDDLTFAIGQEIDPEKKKALEEQRQAILVGKNFTNMNQLRNIKDSTPDIQKPTSTPKPRAPRVPLDMKKLKKKIILFAGIGVVALIIAAILGNYMLPLVKAEIYIESRAIEIEKTLKGNININSLDIEEGEIPIKREEVIVNRSDSARTTGEGKRGSKAEGIVLINNWDRDMDEDIDIAAGTILTSSGGLTFETTVPGILTPRGSLSMPVRATEPGAEYNLSPRTKFTIAGLDSQKQDGENFTAFSGGLSETFPMLTQEDYNNIFTRLQEEAYAEGRKQLEERNPDWSLIEESVIQALDGNVSTDIPIGGEGDLFTLSLATKTEALFFNEKEILDSKEELIKDAAIRNDLFTSDQDLELELDEEIETNITIESVEGNHVTILFKAKGNVRPKIDREEIAKSLLGKSWEEGIEILEKEKFSDEKPKVEFFPKIFPGFLKRFPSREGRVVVETKLIETEVLRDEEEEIEQE
jgi:phosphohistidine swiveling domain-containing protein